VLSWDCAPLGLLILLAGEDASTFYPSCPWLGAVVTVPPGLQGFAARAAWLVSAETADPYGVLSPREACRWLRGAETGIIVFPYAPCSRHQCTASILWFLAAFLPEPSGSSLR